MFNCKQFLLNHSLTFFIIDFYDEKKDNELSPNKNTILIEQFFINFSFINSYITFILLNHNIVDYIFSKSNESFFDNRYSNNEFISIIIDSRVTSKFTVSYI